MAVEVDYVVRLTLSVRLAKRLPELLEGGRTQDVEVVGLAVGLAEPAEELARHGAERHIPVAPRPAEDQKDADLSFFLGRQAGSAGRVGLRAHERMGGESQGRVGRWLPQQLPGDRGRLGHARDDLDARLRQPLLDPAPDPPGVVIRQEYRPKQLRPQLGHSPLDPPGDRRRRLLGVLEELFQIPAKIFFILRRKTEGKLGGGRARGTVAGEVEVHPVAAFRHGVLLDAEV